jgi:hypothetical protein
MSSVAAVNSRDLQKLGQALLAWRRHRIPGAESITLRSMSRPFWTAPSAIGRRVMRTRQCKSYAPGS